MNDKLSKYNDEDISNELLIYLRRNFRVYEENLPFDDKKIKFISIFGKSYILQGNKKFLVSRIYNVLKDDFLLEEKIFRRTIKKFLDGVS